MTVRDSVVFARRLSGIRAIVLCANPSQSSGDRHGRGEEGGKVLHESTPFSAREQIRLHGLCPDSRSDSKAADQPLVQRRDYLRNASLCQQQSEIGRSMRLTVFQMRSE